MLFLLTSSHASWYLSISSLFRLSTTDCYCSCWLQGWLQGCCLSGCCLSGSKPALSFPILTAGWGLKIKLLLPAFLLLILPRRGF